MNLKDGEKITCGDDVLHLSGENINESVIGQQINETCSLVRLHFLSAEEVCDFGFIKHVKSNIVNDN